MLVKECSPYYTLCTVNDTVTSHSKLYTLLGNPAFEELSPRCRLVCDPCLNTLPKDLLWKVRRQAANDDFQLLGCCSFALGLLPLRTSLFLLSWS